MDHHLITRNRLLAALAPSDFALLAPQLTAFSLDEGAILQEADTPIDEVYFPIRGLISLATVMRTGEMVETAMVGREGAIGSFAGLTSVHASARAIVQMATIKLVPVRPGQKILYSPWSEPTLADCWVDSRPQVNVPEGVIITLGGGKIPYVARLPRPPLRVALG